MTVICGGGASSPKPGIAATVIFTSSSIASILNNKGGGWATLVAPLLGVLAYEATTLCESDPPADPGLTPEDYLALLRLDNLENFATAVGKLADLVKIAVWYELCECDSITTPSYPTEPFIPPVGFGQPPALQSAPCWSFTSTELGTFWAGSPTGVPAAGFRNHLLPPGTLTLNNVPAPHEDHLTRAYDPAWKRFRITRRVGDGYPASGVASDVGLYFTNGTGYLGGSLGGTIDNSPGGAYPAELVSETSTIPVGTTGVTVQVQQQGSSTPQPVVVTVDIWCDSASPLSAPCPPDTSMGPLLTSIYELLSLIQRQHVPFAYVPGLEYPGLTGNGEVTFSDPILRAKVELTTLPGHYGMAEGSPDAIFDVGFIALGTADGFERSQAIAHSPMLLQVAGDVTKIGYSLNVGVVAKITTYSREP